MTRNSPGGRPITAKLVPATGVENVLSRELSVVDTIRMLLGAVLRYGDALRVDRPQRVRADARRSNGRSSTDAASEVRCSWTSCGR
jgi:hypothetical protein